MKKAITIISILIISGLQLKAQGVSQGENEVKTVFGNGGGFGGFLEFGTQAGDVNGQAGLLVGGALKAVFSSRMNIGLAGYGLATEVKADTYSPSNKLYQIDMGYGGLIFEPVIGNKKMLHLTVPVLLGIGGIGLREERFTPIEGDSFDIDEYEAHDEDVFLIVEPGLNVEINLLRHVRLNLGGTYRYVYDSNIEGISDEELSGFAASVGLKLGWF